MMVFVSLLPSHFFSSFTSFFLLVPPPSRYSSNTYRKSTRIGNWGLFVGCLDLSVSVLRAYTSKEKLADFSFLAFFFFLSFYETRSTNCSCGAFVVLSLRNDDLNTICRRLSLVEYRVSYHVYRLDPDLRPYALEMVFCFLIWGWMGMVLSPFAVVSRVLNFRINGSSF